MRGGTCKLEKNAERTCLWHQVERAVRQVESIMEDLKTIQYTEDVSIILFSTLRSVRLFDEQPADFAHKRLQVSLHDGVGHEGGGDGLASEPASVEAVDGLASVRDGVELDEDIALRFIS